MTVVTANTRQARGLRREFERRRQAAGEAFWEDQDVLPWGAWLARLWEELIYEGGERRILLSKQQEQVLWEQTIASSLDGADLLNERRTAAAAAEAWALLHDWRMPRRDAAFAEVPDTAAFYGWMRSFEAELKTRGFITAAELPGLFLKKGFTRPAAVAGFDEPTSMQKALFEGVPAMEIEGPKTERRARMALAGAAEEVWAAAEWAREKLEANPAARVGVVFPDLPARRAAAERVFEGVLGDRAAFHISAPAALSQVSMIAAALLALKLCEGLTLAEAGLLLRSPYFRYSAQAGARADVWLRRERRSFVSLEDGEMARLFPGLTKPRERMRPSGWSAALSKLVVTSGWPGERTLSSEEYQAAESWNRLLAEFARLDAVIGEMEFSAALNRLKALAADTGFGAEEEDEPVQAMGVLEAAGARFDALWIGGLHDGAWPPMGRPNPFLPLALQREAGSPNSSIELQYDYAKRITERLLGSAREVVCSHPLRAGEVALRVSPLIAGVASVEAPRTEPIAVPAKLEATVLDAAPPLGEDGFVRGGMSVLADQSACPFRAFAKYRLGARGLELVEPGMSDQERGTVTHAALATLWGELKTRRALLEAGAAELGELIERSVEQAVEAMRGKGTRLRELESGRLRGLLRDWLELERKRPEFEAVQIENKRRYRIAGLELEIRADRVDRYEDGSVAILDYKTGRNNKPAKWASERPEEPQLPLYSIATEEKVSTVSYAQVAAGDLRLNGYSECADSGLKSLREKDLEEQIAEWRGVLNALASDFVKGEAAVDPRKLACRRCDLAGLCRVSAMEDEELEDD